MNEREGILHWATAFAAAVLVLALAAPLISAAAPFFGKSKKRAHAYQLTTSVKGKAVISAKNVVPGQSGSGKVFISNTGKRPLRRVTLTQSSASNAIGTGIQLQVFDSTTKRCLYPAPPRKAKRPAKKCTGWGRWVGKGKLKNVRVQARRGAKWRVKERHTVHVRWRASKDIPQGRSARFNLVWRASA